MVGEGGKAEGGRDGAKRLAAMVDAQVANFLLHLRRALQRLLRPEARHHQDEFLSAQAKRIALFTQCLAQHAAHRLEHGVAGVMAELIIEMLEMVDVDHQAGQRRALPLGLFHLIAQHLVEVAAIGEPGERVGHRHFAQRVAQPQVGERQADILAHHLDIFFGADDIVG